MCGIWVGFSFGCSKKDGPNPEDTVLIKSGGRNTFMNGDGIAGRFDNDDFANGGDVINNEWGDEELVLQDSSWGDDDALQAPDRPFAPTTFGIHKTKVHP